jgi:hypothetical protein
MSGRFGPYSPLTRQKLDAGVSDNVAVVQSQDAVASAQPDYINSLFALTWPGCPRPGLSEARTKAGQGF